MKKCNLLLSAIAVFSLSAMMTAQSIQVLSPNGGEVWRMDTSQDIIWGFSGIESGTLQITLWKGGSNLGVIATGLPYTQRSYAWKAGRLASGGMVPATSGYTIKIRLQGETANDFSDSPFSIESDAPNIRCESMRSIGWEYTFLPSTFTAGDTVTIHYHLMNDSATAAGPFQVGLRVGGTIVDRNAVAELENGDEIAGQFTWTAVCGVPVEIVADCDGAVAESNESDNIMTDPGLACTLPNLFFQRTGFSGSDPASASADMNYQFTAVIMAGTATCRNVHITAGVTGGDVLVDRTVPVMNNGDTELVQFVWQVPAGPSQVVVRIDPENAIAESNEDDNIWTLDLNGVRHTPSEEHYDLSLKLDKMPGLRPVGTKIMVPLGKAITLSGKIYGATGAIRDVNIAGTVKVKDNFPEKVYSTTIHRIESMVVPFSFSWTPSKLGATTISVNVSPGPYASGRGVRDANPANNTDSIEISVVKPKPVLRKM